MNALRTTAKLGRFSEMKLPNIKRALSDEPRANSAKNHPQICSELIAQSSSFLSNLNFVLSSPEPILPVRPNKPDNPYNQNDHNYGVELVKVFSECAPVFPELHSQPSQAEAPRP